MMTYLPTATLKVLYCAASVLFQNDLGIIK